MSFCASSILPCSRAHSILWSVPRLRLSSMMIRSTCSSLTSRSAMCEPISPHPPVIRTVLSRKFILDIHSSIQRLDAALRRVEDFDDAHPRLAVGYRLLAGLNAGDEMLGHSRQRFAGGQIRRPDVAAPVADHRQ